ncbi:rhodanese-related sulfurtransferase [Alkalibacillus sp. S2W]|uniref:oxygen-dependent tRNA uridine(34) hydroxylase TrhO n=1 Tax=Alkalibacillus sp. S2W TaxID=3386553 RepID=UPI00398C878F
MMSNKDYRVLLYYKYVPIEDPETFRDEHLQFCFDLGLKGRILVAEEGLNGTVSGTVEQTNKYMEALRADPRFADIEFKIDEADDHAFKKMHVRHRDEIVNLSLDEEEDVSPMEDTAEFLDPKEFHEEMQRDDAIILDARNDYEYDVGHFRGAIRPNIRTFRELPDWIKENKDMLEGKRVLTYCTGGIRCERFTGWLKDEGIDDVGQLHGGIVTYGKDPEVQGDLWDGQCYVFDERITVPINQVEHNVVGRDYFTGEPCERYINCANPDCNEQLLASEENEHFFMRSCSPECREHPRNRYIEEHGLSEEEVQAKLAKIEASKKQEV